MRKVLLIEPNYENKYPPIGLMKLATYHKELGDEVRFFKGTLNEFVLEEILTKLFENLYRNFSDIKWDCIFDEIKNYILLGKVSSFEKIIEFGGEEVDDLLKLYRNAYSSGNYIEENKWDRVCITTLFTFYYDKTVKTINDFKKICKDEKDVLVGGILATVLPDDIFRDTNILPIVGLLDKKLMIDNSNDYIIDNMYLDYSILDDIDYIYPENNGFYGYMSRGCINNCEFCLVPKMEPKFQNYKDLTTQLKCSKDKYYNRKNLLLLDNNVLASSEFNEIIDDIVNAGFYKGATFVEENLYNYYIEKIKNKIEIRINKKGLFKFLKTHCEVLKENTKAKVDYLNLLEKYEIRTIYSFDLDKIFDSENDLGKYFDSYYKRKRPKQRYVDFNQGLEAKLLTDEKAKKLSEIPIYPLRIAFDHWAIRNTYENAIRIANKYNIDNMSNYILYNFNDKPDELYHRLKLNIDLCEELDIKIYSFPMKYHPITDPEYFRNRKYIGKHWNRKYIRAIQAILNATKGKIGRGKSYFEEAFGKDVYEFNKILYMPESLIIYRKFYRDQGTTERWFELFSSLTEDEKEIIIPIIHSNVFDYAGNNKVLMKLMEYYNIPKTNKVKVDL